MGNSVVDAAPNYYQKWKDRRRNPEIAIALWTVHPTELLGAVCRVAVWRSRKFLKILFFGSWTIVITLGK